MTGTYPAGCTSTVGYSSTTGAKCDGGTTTSTTLTGGTGDITLDDLSTYSGENVGEGASDVKVMGFSVEADDNSDVSVGSIKVEFFQATTADSRKLEDYADKVTVWMGSTKVGEANPSDFSESSKYYSKSISLSNAVVKKGETAKFYVAVDALDNLDGGDIDTDDWSVDLLSVRFTDADGVVTTETADASGTDGAGTYEKSFDFDTFASANAVTLKTALKTGSAADAINLAHVINVESGANDTDNVPVLNFTLKAEGSDLNITEIPVTLTVTGGSTDESALLKGANLLMGTDEIGNEVVANGGAVTFDNLDITVKDGETVSFTVTVDIQDLTGALTDGDTVQASITGTNADAIVAEDETGEELSDTETSGSAVGIASTVHDSGIQVAFVTSTAVVSHAGDVANTTDSDQGTFTITFDVTAFDGDMYIDGTKPTEGAAAASIARVNVSNTDTYVDSNIRSSTGATLSGTVDADARYLVLEGQTERFTVTYVTTAGADGLFQVSLVGLSYAAGDNTGDTLYNFNLDEFKSPSLNMQNDAA